MFRKHLIYLFLTTLTIPTRMWAADVDSTSVKTSDSTRTPKSLKFLKEIFSSSQDSMRRGPNLMYTLNWDARSSFIDKKFVNIWGVNTGIKFGRKRHELTFGYYWLTFNSFLRLIDFRKNASRLVNLGYYTKTDLYFFSLMYVPKIIENKRWRFSLPVELGIGATQSSGNKLLNDLMIWRRNDFFMPAQAGFYLKWKATRWVGFSTQGGYRYALYQQNLPTNYNGPYYSLGFTLESEAFTDSYQWAKKTIKKRQEKRSK
ncbi:hypothetical protein [Runella limosa]|uniref:hypothetical protein n=1 Tax=Runella limosa TaxID=370978 RepID=UPI001B7FC63F|nr:hypothetical protein [Runella limosa]